LVAMEVGSPPLPKKSLSAGQLDQPPTRIGTKLSPETPGSKPEPQDPKTQSLTTCEVCGACFETRKGLSSHARSHLRQLGVAESESSGAPIDLLYELVKQKGKSDGGPLAPLLLSKKTASPKDAAGAAAASPRPSLLALAKGIERPPEGAVNKAIKSPPGFSKSLGQPGSPLLKKVPSALSVSPSPKNLEEKSSKLSLSPLQSSPKSQWSQDEEGPLNLKGMEEGGKDGDERRKKGGRRTGGRKEEDEVRRKEKGEKEKGEKASPSTIHPFILPSIPPSVLPSIPPPTHLFLHPSIPPSNPPSIRPTLPPSFQPSLHPSNPPSLLPTLPPSLRPADPGRSVAPTPCLPAASGPEPVRDIRCEFCGEFFENRKGLSSHARSHLRQMGVTEWYVNGSPIDTLREILKRRSHPRSAGASSPAGPGPKALAKSLLGPLGSLEPRGPAELHIPGLSKKVQQAGSPLGHSPTSSPPPTARKMFPGLSPPSLQKKLKQDHMRVEIKREMMAGGIHGEPHPSDCVWPPREDMSPLNLSSRADPVRDIRCEFCGEFFENRKGLSSHARSHLRQMGVTEWSVNGSPIDTLREILKKKPKPCVIKKEPHSIELPKSLGDDEPKSPGKLLPPPPMALPPLGAGRTGKQPGAGASALGRELSLCPLGTKAQGGGFLTPLATKRPLQDDRLGPHGEVKHKPYGHSELPYKAKALHDKPAHTAAEACCELCGLYFENRKALASHARAHLRQFGVTEWCVNGSPIETLSEWIRHRPQKAGAYRSYIQGGRPFTKKFRNSAHDGARRLHLGLQSGAGAGSGGGGVAAFLTKGFAGDLGHGDPTKLLDGGSGERPLITSPLSLVKLEEHQRSNINKFERRQPRPHEPPLHRDGAGAEFPQKLEESRQPPPRVRPVPALVPRPPQTSLVKFVGNIYTLKCRFCEVEFQGPLSIQEEWVRHLQRHILEMNFSKADPVRSEAPPAASAAPPEPPALAEA
ncbi:WIZ protein, partial [Rhinopomastus cyanomelas]|nr:WIZ protein [Rhinopomastus cyanomelas]